jgi:hypothetical protein
MAVQPRSPLARQVDVVREELASLLRTCADFLAPKPKTPDLAVLLDSAPVDDELVTREEREAIDRAEAEIRRGEIHPLDEIKREFG